ncbi:TrkA C-terminal domain-containing protein [Sulfidibacter corallicola]|uniref:TrkA C-terminal domain-containing protein n=1 Tax=Sulfidibacter corallicola TaxID=2818388 RepID=A0A8A4THY9_SULCO|nr:TrkA C-terminal domain-containing protein [Sulfidibacter corallicola]QTD48441.1 TrkA C-terminal domain-containing protein [Sulfidibacter corallicola]
MSGAVPLEAGFAVAKIAAPERFFHKALADLKLRPRHGLNLICIYRQEGPAGEEHIISNPEAKPTIEPGDQLGVVAHSDDLRKICLTWTPQKPSNRVGG